MGQCYTSLQDVIKIKFELVNVECPCYPSFEMMIICSDPIEKYSGGDVPICLSFETSDWFLFHLPDHVSHPKFGATFDVRVMSMLGQEMYAVEFNRYQLVDFPNLLKIVLHLYAFSFGGVG
jgi:hypothetical protein